MIFVIGRVTKDLVEQTGKISNKSYLAFDLAENKGFGENAKTEFHRCLIFDEKDIAAIKNAGVKTGSLITVFGDQEIEAYIKQNGEAGATSNIYVKHWDYVHLGSKKSGEQKNADVSGTPNADNTSITEVISEICDDGLPV